MELGPFQKKWIQSLRDYPERQMSNYLGRVKDGSLQYACCLGQALWLLGPDQYEVVAGRLLDTDDYCTRGVVLEVSYKNIGLHSREGKLKGAVLYHHDSLAAANDSGVSWLEIADFIEANPEAVFSKSI